MAKYDPLRDELASVGAARIAMTFGEIEQLIGRLPASAWNFPWWWGNKDDQTHHQVQCNAWGAAGYVADADIDRRTVVFTRKS
jgi:hypothetical protein